MSVTAKRPVGVSVPGAPTVTANSAQHPAAIAQLCAALGEVDLDRDPGRACLQLFRVEPDPAELVVRQRGGRHPGPAVALANDAEHGRRAELGSGPRPGDDLATRLGPHRDPFARAHPDDRGGAGAPVERQGRGAGARELLRRRLSSGRRLPAGVAAVIAPTTGEQSHDRDRRGGQSGADRRERSSSRTISGLRTSCSHE